MARIRLLQSRGDGSEPSGAAAGVVERYHAGLISQRSRSNRTPATKAGRAPGPVETAKRGILISRGLTRQGCGLLIRTVKVRILPREPWDLRAAECSPPCQGGGRGFKSRRSRHGRLAQMAERQDDNLEAGGSRPPATTMPRWRNGLARPTTDRKGAGSNPVRGTQGRLAQSGRAPPPHGGRREFKSLTDHGGRSSIRQSAGL